MSNTIIRILICILNISSGIDNSGVYIAVDHAVKSIVSGGKSIDVYGTAWTAMEERMLSISSLVNIKIKQYNLQLVYFIVFNILNSSCLFNRIYIAS